jgi:hypothetical protein
MLTPNILLNAVANACTASAVYFLLWRIWLDKSQKIHDNPTLCFIRKAGLCVTICSAVGNIMTAQDPLPSETLMSFAVAANFVSVALLFKKNEPKQQRTPVHNRARNGRGKRVQQAS